MSGSALPMFRHLVHCIAFCICLIAVSPAGASQKQVELKINGKIALADLVVPDGGSVAEGVLLITHGTLAHKDMELVETLQAAMAERGVATLAHSLTLAQDRRTGMYDCAVPHAHAHEDAVEEISAWVGWLKEQGAKSISLLGHSRGGNQVAWYAAQNAGAEKVVLLAPALGLSGKFAATVLKRRNGADIKPAFKKATALVADGKGETMLEVPGFIYCQEGKATARAIASYYGEDKRRNAIDNLAKIDAPILVIAGSKDTAVPDVPAKIKPIADGEKVRFELIEDAGHMFLDFYAEDAADLVESFLKE